MNMNLPQQIESLKAMIDEVLKRQGIPKNIRATIEEVKVRLARKRRQARISQVPSMP